MESEFVLWGFCFCFVLDPELKVLALLLSHILSLYANPHVNFLHALFSENHRVNCNENQDRPPEDPGEPLSPQNYAKGPLVTGAQQ